MATTVPPRNPAHLSAATRPRREDPITPARGPAVSMWALLGAAIVVFEAYVIARWVTGPFFETVPSGPSQTPPLMKANLILWQVVPIPVTTFMVWRFVVRPWRRERNVGVDGMFTLAFLTIWFQDPISNYGGTWIAYNSDTVNFGSWTTSIPGWLSFSQPGKMLAEPLLFTPPAYAPLFLVGAVVGCWGLRLGRRRFPGSLPKMLLTCFVAVCAFDLVIEGFIWLPGGVYEYPGGHLPILFADRYFKFPLLEILAVGVLFTSLASLRFFLDDRGQTVVERGSERLQIPQRRKILVRALAVTAATQMIFLLAYNVPMGFINGMHPAEWPKDLQKRSYFTGGICGEGTGRPCPGPGVPLFRNDNSGKGGGSAYLDTSGRPVFGAPVAPVVPFDRGPSGRSGG